MSFVIATEKKKGKEGRSEDRPFFSRPFFFLLAGQCVTGALGHRSTRPAAGVQRGAGRLRHSGWARRFTGRSEKKVREMCQCQSLSPFGWGDANFFADGQPSNFSAVHSLGEFPSPPLPAPPSSQSSCVRRPPPPQRCVGTLQTCRAQKTVEERIDRRRGEGRRAGSSAPRL